LKDVKLKKSWKGIVSVVIAAAGKGTRMNLDINKQYIEICRMPVLARTIEAFQECRFIDEIVLVINQNDLVYCKKNIIDAYGFTKVGKIVAGGDKRQQSVFKGLNEVSRDCEIVLIHDGARPFIREDVILESIAEAKDFGASCVAVPVKDTIKRSGSEGFFEETLQREGLWSIQTPQTFKYEIIKDAHEQAVKDGFEGTDDSVLVERLGLPVKIVMGSYDNIKITTQEDLAIGEAIIKGM